uniref:Uncharacterized protein n=1 Tax=Panagrolaimus sp. PS1159 TaxID=55785 RepID=A0AC35FZZ0_9BILA
MVLPVIEHRLTKIGHANRRRFIRTAFCFSAVACFANLISSTTNKWLYTAEVLKYYVLPNNTHGYDDEGSLRPKPLYFKNATIGPWWFCWDDPTTPWTCYHVDYSTRDEATGDVTSSIVKSMRPMVIFMVLGCFLDIFGLSSITICCLRKKPYFSLFATTLAHILAGIANFQCIIVYMSAVSEEVGNKIFPASEMEDPVFYYTDGYSFMLLKFSFLCTETAGLLSALVYMSKRDERTYNRYRIHTIMKNVRHEDESESPHMKDRYHDHSRMQCLQKASRSASIDASLASSTGQRPLYYPSRKSSTIETAQLRQFLEQQFLLPPSAVPKTLYF